jgi:hypothetical protein
LFKYGYIWSPHLLYANSAGGGGGWPAAAGGKGNPLPSLSRREQTRGPAAQDGCRAKTENKTFGIKDRTPLINLRDCLLWAENWRLIKVAWIYFWLHYHILRGKEQILRRLGVAPPAGPPASGNHLSAQLGFMN